MDEGGVVIINGEEFEIADDLTFYAEIDLIGSRKNIKVKAVDYAGNESAVESFTVVPKPNKETVPPGPIQIVSTVVTDENTVEVTFNGKVKNLDPSDLELNSAMGDWEGLNPKLTDNFTIVDTDTFVNEAGQSVVVFKTEETINLDGTIDRQIPEDPQHVPLLKDYHFSSDMEENIQQADYLLSWQMEHGGWYKNWFDTNYKRMWDGSERKSESYSYSAEIEAGTTDNNATIDEILFMTLVYNETGDERYKESLLKGINYLLESQYDTGGFPQMYPLVGGYPDNATFNDNAMNRVLNALSIVAEKSYPFNDDVVSDELAAEAQVALDLALDFILESQIEVDGELTAWGQQHDPYTYEATKGRSFELPSISGFESVSVVAYLMSLPQTEEIKIAVEAALRWFEDVKLDGIRFDRFDEENMIFFYEDPDAETWYRYYEIGTNRPVYANRDGIMLHDFFELEGESKWTYMWAGDFASNLLEVASTTGYYENRAYVKVVGNNSTNIAGETLVVGDLHRVE